MSTSVSVHRINAIVVEERQDITGTHYRIITFKRNGENVLEVTAFGSTPDDLNVFDEDGYPLESTPCSG